MSSITRSAFNSKKYLSNQAARVLAVSLIVALISQLFVPMQPSVVHAETAAANARCKQLTDIWIRLYLAMAPLKALTIYKDDFTSAITGFLGEPARVSNPTFAR